MKKLFICDHCGFPVEAVLYPSICPQCSNIDNYYMNADYHLASEEERRHYEWQTAEHLNYSLSVIKDVYGKKAAEQIRKLFMHINSAETGDDVDIRIEREESMPSPATTVPVPAVRLLWKRSGNWNAIRN